MSGSRPRLRGNTRQIERVRENQRFLRAGGIAACATAVFAAWVGWSIGGATATMYVDDLATVLVALAAAVLCFHAGQRDAKEMRRFWLLLGAACGAWALGEAGWAYYDLVLGTEVPVPSWADVGYLSGIPLAVAALVCHPALHGSGTHRARSVLDGLTVATALFFLSWTIVLGPLWHSTHLSTLGGVVAFAYPFGDVVIIFFIVLAIRGMTGGGRIGLWCLLGGLFALALADSTYSYLAGVKGYETGSLIDAGWFIGYLGIAMGAYCSGHSDALVRRPAMAIPAMSSLVAPFLPVLVALSVVAVKMQLGHTLDDVSVLSAFALVALALGRQALLVLDLVGRGDDPEAMVAKRLAHIALGHDVGERR